MYFSHEKLDVYVASEEAFVLGLEIVHGLPRGYGFLADQFRRALLASHLGVSEAVNRTGADRSMRARIARAETAESGAALRCITLLKLADVERAARTRELLIRVYAMLTKLGKLGT